MILYHELWHPEGSGFKKDWAVAYWSFTLARREDWMRRYNHVYLIYVRMETRPWSYSCPKAAFLPLIGSSRYTDSQRPTFFHFFHTHRPPRPFDFLAPISTIQSFISSRISSLFLPFKMQSTISGSHPHSAITTSSSHQLAGSRRQINTLTTEATTYRCLWQISDHACIE